MATAFKLTDEQTHAIELARKLEPLKISAFAGTGKTSTLEAIGRALDRPGLYLAFNKAIATDAEKRMPKNVQAKTFHSIAYQAKGKPFKSRLGQRLNGSVVADALNLAPFKLKDEAKFSASALGSMCLQTVNYFCRSLDTDIHAGHVPHSDIVGLTASDRKTLAAQIVEPARTLWKMMSDPKGHFPVSHDMYVKLWALDEPEITGFDFLLFDEAQDADSLMLSVVQKQRNLPVFWVGDKHQQIYSWRGAINAMQTIATPHEAALTLSFRFGQEIADQANRLLGFMGESRKIIGNPAVTSTVHSVSSPDAILCRTNAEVVSQLLGKLGLAARGKVAATGASEALAFYEAARKLMSGIRPTGALCLFETWSQLVEYSETDDGADLATYIRLEDEYGIENIIHALSNVVDASKSSSADLVISTAHRAKGLEWNSVQLARDFKVPGGKKEPNEEEVRLLYVAMTRAKERLDLSLLPEGFAKKTAQTSETAAAPKKTRKRQAELSRDEERSMMLLALERSIATEQKAATLAPAPQAPAAAKPSLPKPPVKSSAEETLQRAKELIGKNDGRMRALAGKSSAEDILRRARELIKGTSGKPDIPRR